MRFFVLLLLLIDISIFAKPLSKEVMVVPVAYKKRSLPNRNKLNQILSAKDHNNMHRVAIVVDNEFDKSLLKKYGYDVISVKGNIFYIEGPKETLPFIKQMENVLYVEKNFTVHTLMDKAREASFVDPVHDSLSQMWNNEISGEGVIVAVLDAEFDIRHPAFLDENGDTRFIAVWDFYPEDDEELPSFAYNKDRIPYGAALMGDELKQFPHIGLGNSTHGTHVASISAGSVTGNGLHGFAPKAHLIGVKIYQDGDAAIDKFGNPFFTKSTSYSGELSHAIEWVFKIADSLNMPCVINMSLGSTMGPHDGTSIFDQFIDSVSGPGRVLVGSAGNSGSNRIHINFNLTSGDTSGTWGEYMTFNKDSSGNNGAYILIDFWGEVGTEFSIQGVVKNKSTSENIKSTFVSNKSSGEWEPDTAYWNNDTIIFYFETDSSVIMNNKSRMVLGIVSSNTDVDFGFRVTGDGELNAWHSNMYRNFNSNGIDGFIDGDTLNTILEIGGTSNSVISVGAYVTRGSGVSWDGDTLHWLYDDLGEVDSGIAIWSSMGPTIDGRQKPDVAAPGKMIAAACSRMSNEGGPIIATWPNYPDTTDKYAYLRGTSMSAPMMTGAVALFLQLDPSLDQEKIKSILNSTSYSDKFTGSVPNYHWGAGKLNVLNAVNAISEPSPNLKHHTKIINRNNHKFKLNANNLVYNGNGIKAGTTLNIYDFRGRLIISETYHKFTKSIKIPLKNLSSSASLIVLKNKDKTIFKDKVLIIN